MQPVDNDIDDLYRKAAEDYPLKTDGADWNKLLQKMESATGAPPAYKKEGKGRLLWLLLLLPMFFICNRYTSDFRSKLLGKQPTEINDVSENTKNTQQEQAPGNEVTDNTKGGSGLQKSGLEKNKLEGEDLLVNKKVGTEKEQIVDIKSKDQKQFTIANKKQKNSNERLNRTEKKNRNVGSLSREKFTENDESETGLINRNELDKNEELTNSNPGSPIADKNSEAVSKSPVKKADEAKKDSASSKEEQVTKKSKPSVPNKKLYWGILAGPDFSMVKSGKVHGVGSSFGIIGGYRFAKKWVVETGVFWDKKDYQSEGQYFKTGKTGWPQHTSVVDISGYCKMFEVPISVRYDFSANAGRSWFATAGVSSYFMKNESYDYTVERYGVRYYGEKEYKNSSTNWLSVIHVSVGYEKTIGGIGSIRIEPYVKLPVRGVGIGSLPLRSTGIYIGITRPIR